VNATLLLISFLFPPPVVAYGLAPVYVHESPTVLKRITTFRYKMRPDLIVLYCIAPDPNAVTIQCVVMKPGQLILADADATELKL
jgi:hypothetical protein